MILYTASKDVQTLEFIHRSKEYGWVHIDLRIWVMLISDHRTVTVKCRTALKELFLCLNLCLSVKLDCLACSFTFIFYYSYWFDISDSGLLVTDGIIRPVLSVSALTWLIIYIYY